MKLLRAHIDGFGRYVDTEFQFQDGLNLVIGRNEAGKSTLQQFLVAMLYGLKKPGRKRAVYCEEEARYRPWAGTRYGGILWFEQDGNVYRIERNLRREDESVRVYDDLTGEDLTPRFPIDSRKESSFALTLLGCDRDQFLHTLCIGPVDERERVRALQDALQRGDHLEGSFDALSGTEQQGIRQAEEALRKRLDHLGTERAPTKPYGGALKALDEAKRLYRGALEREESQREARTTAESADTELLDAQADERVLRDQLLDRLGAWLGMQEARRGELRARLQQLEQTLHEAEHQLPFDGDEADMRELQSDFQQLLAAKRDQEKFSARLETLHRESGEVAWAEPFHHIEEQHLLQVERTARELEATEGRLEQLSIAAPATEERDRLEREYRAKRLLMWGSAALGAVATPFAVSHYWALAIVALGFAFALWNLFQFRALEGELRDWEAVRDAHAAQQQTDEAEQERLTALLLDLLQRFAVDTPRQYRQKWHQLVATRERAAQLEKQAAWLRGEQNRAKGEHDIIARRLLRQLDSAQDPAQWDAADLEGEIRAWEQRIEEARERKEQLHVWSRERDQLHHQLERLEVDVAHWQNTATELGLPQTPATLFTQPRLVDVTAPDLERLYQAWRTAEKLLHEKMTQQAEASTRYEVMSEGQISAADRLLQLEAADAHLQMLQEERDALQLAASLWAEVGEEMYRQIAPQFHEQLAAVTARLTKGRYQHVRLDFGSAGITAQSPDTGHTVALDTLSAGTVDQIALALGLALAGLTLPGGDHLPLLLDEPFRRYDDERLEEALQLLLDESASRQILLFTCREQEAERLHALAPGGFARVELQPVKYGMIRG